MNFVHLFPYKLFLVDLRPAGTNPEVVEHVAPLSAVVGQEFLDNLASRGRKNKTPASEAGSLFFRPRVARLSRNS